MLKKFSLTIVAIIICILCNSLYAQTTKSKHPETELTSLKLKDVHIKAQSVKGVFSKLAFLYDIPIGVEIALNDDSLIYYDIYFKEGSLTDFLNHIMSEINKQKVKYDWEINDGVINIYPKELYKDFVLTSLLNTKINNFNITTETSAPSFVKSLVNTQEVKENLRSKGLSYQARGLGGFYIRQLGKNFTLNVTNMKVKSILNEVVRESPIAKFWYIERNNFTTNTFTIVVNARFENSQKDKIPRFQPEIIKNISKIKY